MKMNDMREMFINPGLVSYQLNALGLAHFANYTLMLAEKKKKAIQNDVYRHPTYRTSQVVPNLIRFVKKHLLLIRVFAYFLIRFVKGGVISLFSIYLYWTMVYREYLTSLLYVHPDVCPTALSKFLSLSFRLD